MVLSDEADSGNAFDAVYSTAHADKDTKDHFISPASMLLEAAVNETGNEDAQRAKLAQHKASASPLAPPGVLLQACTPACVEEEAWRRRCGGGGVEEEVWRRCGGGGVEEEVWRRRCGGGGVEEEVWRRRCRPRGRAAPPESCAADQRLTTRAAQEDRAAMRRAMDAACEPKGLGSEQLDSKTNFEGHSMNIAADAPSADSAYDNVYSTAHANKDTKSYFDAGMALSDEADAGLAFDRVYGSQHEAARAETAFKNGFQLKKGYSVPG